MAAARGVSAAERLARKAWRIQYIDSPQSIDLAEQAARRAEARGDAAAQAWVDLVRGYHRMRHVSPAEGAVTLEAAQAGFKALHDMRGQILASVGIARCWWMQGRTREALDRVLPLRPLGLERLHQEERGLMLNTIAGCYSVLGQSALAFAYMYQALRECSAARHHGFEAVLYCNLGHELHQLGDCHEALSYLQEGLMRARSLNNPRLVRILLVNRVLCLTDLNRAHEAITDVRSALTLPPEATGASDMPMATLAIAVLRSGDVAWGEQLHGQARASLGDGPLPEVRLECEIAQAELQAARGDAAAAASTLRAVLPLPAEGLSLRIQCVFHQLLADLCERCGDTAGALRHMRDWQKLHMERSDQASRARHQAASLQTELLRLQRERDEIEARRRATERAKAELETINLQLSQRMQEVQSLQSELRDQAVHDALTGLHNRRYLNQVFENVAAQALRERQPLAVVIIDLDHFKAVNDRHGHLTGDRVLQAFGALLAKACRRQDIACRYGGEEFCVLMPRTDAAGALRRVQALQKEWHAADCTTPDGQGVGPFTFSAGIADSLTTAGAPQELLVTADARVFDAKRLGRDRVVSPGGDASTLAPTLSR